MPFAKLGHGRYEGPSGRKFDLAQVRLWYAKGGKFPGQKSDKAVPAEGAKHRRVRTHPAMKPK